MTVERLHQLIEEAQRQAGGQVFDVCNLDELLPLDSIAWSVLILLIQREGHEVEPCVTFRELMEQCGASSGSEES